MIITLSPTVKLQNNWYICADWGGKMARKKKLAELIIGYSMEGEVLLAKGSKIWSGMREDRHYGADPLPME